MGRNGKTGAQASLQPYSMAAFSAAGSLLFGTPFLLMGLFVLGVGLGVVPVESSGGDAPMAVIAGIGGLFALVGAAFWVSAGKRFYRQARWNAVRRSRPFEPWAWDHAWDPAGARHGATVGLFRGLVACVGATAFAAPFHWWAFHSGEGVVPVMAVAAFLDLLALLCLGGLVYALGRGLKYGGSFLRYRVFPFFLGERLDADLEGLDRLSGFQRLTVSLRCVEDRVTRQGKSTQVDAVAVHEETRELSPDELPLGRGGGAGVFKLVRLAPRAEGLPVSFQLPSGDLETVLSASPARRWEVVVRAETPGIDYEAVFLVPVYRRPDGATPAIP